MKIARKNRKQHILPSLQWLGSVFASEAYQIVGRNESAHKSWKTRTLSRSHYTTTPVLRPTTKPITQTAEWGGNKTIAISKSRTHLIPPYYSLLPVNHLPAPRAQRLRSQKRSGWGNLPLICHS